MVDLTKPEQLILASILQSSKANNKPLNIRDNSRFRSNKRKRRRYRKVTQFTGKMDAYKEHLNEENKFDQSSVKAINKQLKAHLHMKRNLPKMDHLSSHINEKGGNKKVPLPIYSSHNNEADLKLK